MNSVTKWLMFITISAMAVTGLAFYFNRHLKDSSEKLFEYISRVESHVTEEEWEKARNEFIRTEKYWNSTKQKWLLTINNSELEAVSLTLTRLNKFIELQEKSESLVELAELLLLLESIVQKSEFSIKNML